MSTRLPSAAPVSVSKQAAAKTIAALAARGYVLTEDDPADGRRTRIRVTARGQEVMREGEVIFDELRAAWAKLLGNRQLLQLEQNLAAFVGDAPIRLEAPGWVSRYPE